MFTICSFYLCLNPLLLGEEWRLDTRLNSEETRPNKGQFTILSDDSLSFTLFLLEHQIFHPDLSTLTQLLCNLVSSQAKQIEDGIPILLATPALIVVFSFRLTLWVYQCIMHTFAQMFMFGQISFYVQDCPSLPPFQH